jgi:hypothetical protein
MLPPGADNRAESECEVKVTLNETESREPIKKHFSNVLHRAGQEGRAQRQEFV